MLGPGLFIRFTILTALALLTFYVLFTIICTYASFKNGDYSIFYDGFSLFFTIGSLIPSTLTDFAFSFYAFDPFYFDTFAPGGGYKLR